MRAPSLIFSVAYWTLTAFALALVSQATAGHLYAQGSIADTIERCEKSVVRIEVKSKDGGGQGSGFVIAKNTLATNVHVLMGGQEATAIFPDGRQFKIVGTVRIDSSRDIALARFEGSGAEDIPILPLSSSTARKGESVVALGSPLGLSFTATTGVVSAIRDGAEITRELGSESVQGEAHRGSWVQLDAALSPGNSGGPVINSAGHVVAMSTLASQGAQNLNFGISSQDIAQMLSTVTANAPVLPLATGVGTIENKEGSGRRGGGGGSRGGESIVDTPPVPKSAIEQYVATGRSEFKALKRNLVNEVSRLRSTVREMNQGQTSIPPQLRSQNNARMGESTPDIIRAQGSRGTTWYFKSKAIKDSVVGTIQTQIRDLNKISQSTADEKDKNALLQLLSKYGPPLDTRRVESVGFVSEATVLHAFNDHDTIVLIDEVPYIMVMKSTSGLYPGSEIIPSPVYVVGTQTIELPRGSSASLTILKQVSQEELSEVVLGKSASSSSKDSTAAAAPGAGLAAGSSGDASGGYRMWHDRTGSFSIEAILLEATDTEVVLLKRDGKKVKVPRSRLSEADQRYLKQ